MRNSTHISVILGVVIIGIIAVFLSTRTSEDRHSKNKLTKQEEQKDNFVLPADIFENDAFVEETLESDIKKVSILPEYKENEEKFVDVDKEFRNTFDEQDIAGENESKPESKPESELIAASDNIVKEPEAVNTLPLKAEMIIQEKVHKKESTHATKALTHKVELTDNLFSMAKKYYGDPKKWIKIYNANTDVIYDKNSLPIGNELIIPDVKTLDDFVAGEISIEDPHTEEPQLRPETSLPSEKIKGGNNKTHVVKPGDSLYKLSRDYYGSTNNWIVIYNANIDKIGANNTLYAGKELIIPDVKTVSKNEPEIKKVEKPYATLNAHSSSSNNQNKISPKSYKVKKGDTLYSIAKSQYNDGTKWRNIYEANRAKIPNINVIRAGETLVIP